MHFRRAIGNARLPYSPIRSTERSEAAWMSDEFRDGHPRRLSLVAKIWERDVTQHLSLHTAARVSRQREFQLALLTLVYGGNLR
jgi:hypothetical protein